MNTVYLSTFLLKLLSVMFSGDEAVHEHFFSKITPIYFWCYYSFILKVILWSSFLSVWKYNLFWALALYSEILPKSFINFSEFLVDSLVFSLQMAMSQKNKKNFFTSSFTTCAHFISFSFSTVLARIFSTMLNKWRAHILASFLMTVWNCVVPHNSLLC